MFLGALSSKELSSDPSPHPILPAPPLILDFTSLFFMGVWSRSTGEGARSRSRSPQRGRGVLPLGRRSSPLTGIPPFSPSGSLFLLLSHVDLCTYKKGPFTPTGPSTSLGEAVPFFLDPFFFPDRREQETGLQMLGAQRILV